MLHGVRCDVDYRVCVVRAFQVNITFDTRSAYNISTTDKIHNYVILDFDLGDTTM